MSSFVAPGQGGYRGPRLSGIPAVQANAASFGGGAAEDAQGFGRLGLQAGNMVLAQAQNEQRRIDTATAKDAFNRARADMTIVSQQLQARKGKDARTIRQDMSRAYDEINRRYGSELSGQNVETMQMFNDSMQGMRETYDVAAARHYVTEMQAFEAQADETEKSVAMQEVASMWSGQNLFAGDGSLVMMVDPEADLLPPINPGQETAKRILRIQQIVQKQMSGSPQAAIGMAMDQAAADVHGVAIDSIAGTGDYFGAMRYLNQPEVVGVMQPAEIVKRRQTLGNEIMKAAKTNSENQARQMGIDLGNQYDNEYEILMAISNIQDREIANIVRTQAEMVRKARIEMKGSDEQDEARRLGIQLGEQYDTDIEILRATDDITDRSVAKTIQDIAKERRTARLADNKTPEDIARENRSNRETAQELIRNQNIRTVAELDAALNGLGDVTEVTREAIRKVGLDELSKERTLTPEEQAIAIREARAQARTLLLGEDGLPDTPDDILDEESIDLALDEMVDLTAQTKERIRRYGVQQLKINQARRTAERAELDQQAMDEMYAKNWDVSAINPQWPVSLQNEMLDLAEKRAFTESQRQSSIAREEQVRLDGERKARGIGYLEMPIEQFNQAILNGEYPRMVDDVGAGTPEHQKIKARAAGQDIGGLTTSQYAKNRYETLVGRVTTGRKQDYEKFMGRIGERVRVRTQELGLDRSKDLPAPIQKEIVDAELVNGDYRWFDSTGYLSWNVRRYQVDDANVGGFWGWKPYDQVQAEQASGQTPSIVPTSQLPDFARPYFGRNDTKRQLISDGRVLIESDSGNVIIVRPDGGFDELNLKEAREALAEADAMATGSYEERLSSTPGFELSRSYQ